MTLLKRQSILIMSSMDVNKNKKWILWICFLTYLVFLSYLLFFANMFGRTEQVEEYRYNLTLFREIERYYSLGIRTGEWRLFFRNVCGNVAVFIPAGIFVASLIKNGRNAAVAALLCFDISLLAETIQLITKVGSFDVDDLLLNTIGGVLGWILWRIRHKADKRMNKRKVRINGKTA